VGVGVVVPAAAFTGGIAAEMASLFDGFWSLVLPVFIPLLLLLTAALVARFLEKTRFQAELGALVGCAAGLLFFLGAFLPFVLEIGERDLTEFGDDSAWHARLAGGLILVGAAGAALGIGCGLVAWAMLAVLGHSPNGRERQTEA
jgi:hypothetical protein